MSDYNEVYNINICKDKCDFVLTAVEYTPNGYSYYKCTKCGNTRKTKDWKKEVMVTFLKSETTRHR